MSSSWYVIEQSALYLLPMVYIAIVIITFVMWGIQGNHPYKPADLEKDKHVYYPYKHTVKFRFFLTLTLIGFLCALLPLFIGLMAYTIFAIDPWIVGGIAAGVGLLITIFAITRPLEPIIECVVVDANYLTIKRKNKDDETHRSTMYKHYIRQSKHQSFRLVFDDYEEKEKEVYLPWLCPRERVMVAEDLGCLRKNGVLPNWRNYYKPEQLKQREAQPQPNNQIQETAKQFAAEQEALVSDPVKYDEYLRGILSSMSIADRNVVIGLTCKGENLLAIKECRERTGIGLKYAKDLVENYMTFPDLRKYVTRIYMRDITIPEIESLLREYGELYTDESGSIITKTDNVTGTFWNYIEFSQKTGRPGNALFWDYLNILLWMTQRTGCLFGYAVSGKNNLQPVIVFPNASDSLGETCVGVMYKSHFNFAVPDHTVTWGNNVAVDFDPKKYISTVIGEDVSGIL